MTIRGALMVVFALAVILLLIPKLFEMAVVVIILMALLADIERRR